jgi:hypothetical protein
MKTFGLFLFEMARVLFYLFVGMAILWYLEVEIYKWFKINLNGHFLLVGIANLLLLFIFYRNHLQFSGWFQSNLNKKLPRSVTIIASVLIFILMVIPIVE